ncbi:MAG: peptidoglycan bridge formation glycyltransferase FemA/FemB family protein [Anaerolineae bacterium]|nr:peptidoglycan bridge formation glycyltransferase FemA/FemB family protein [Anaerolineae bacterium]
MQVKYQVLDHEWDQFVIGHPGGHVLQTSTWGVHQSEFGWRTERVVVRVRDVIVAGAQVLFRHLRWGLTRAYIPKGPLVDYTDQAVCRALFTAIHQVCRARRAILLKIEPDSMDSDLASTLSRYALYPSPYTVQPPRTILIDISGSQDDVLKRMKSKTRYNIRLAERKGIQVRQGHRQDIAAFTRLLAVTGHRDGFDVHCPRYYERAFDLFVPAHRACLLVATFQGQPVAAVMPFAFGDRAWYMYGASGNEHRAKMPNYALQWSAICWAQEQGCTSYDLWGIPDEDEEMLEAQFEERREGLWGVYRFKRGFGGQVTRYAGAFDRIYNKPLYRLYRLALKFRYAS